jgi:hypothetical protein
MCAHASCEQRITIDDEILEQLKARATKESTTLSRLIEDSVQLAARPHSEDGPAFELVTFGKGGRFTSFDLDRISELTEQDDIARHGRRG